MGSSIIQFLTSCAFEASWAAWTQSISFKSPKWYQMIGYILKYTLTQSALIHSMTMPFILSYLDMLWMFKEFAEHILRQGRLKIWTSDSHWFSLSLKPLEISLQKFQHSYNSWKSGFSQNLEDVAQKLSLPRPFDVLDVFCGKSKFCAPKTFIFGTKRVPIEFNNWWKFRVDISNHLWNIQN